MSVLTFFSLHLFTPQMNSDPIFVLTLRARVSVEPWWGAGGAHVQLLRVRGGAGGGRDQGPLHQPLQHIPQ